MENQSTWDSAKFFVDYYHTIGVERVVAFLHPGLNESLPLFEELGLNITIWNVNYDFDVLSHRENHKRALERCIASETERGATAIIVCDPDEFLYFNPQEFDSVHSFLGEFQQMPDVGQIYLSRVYYEMDLCTKRPTDKRERTIWNTPYGGPESIGKSIFFTKNFLGFSAMKFEHHFNVTGRSIKVDHDKGHFKHFRRFLSWDGQCQITKNGNQIEYQENRDQLDPAHKKGRSTHHYYFRRDDTLPAWKEFFEKDKEKKDGGKKGKSRAKKGGLKRPFRKIRTIKPGEQTL